MTVDAIGYVKAREYIEANYEWDKSGRGYIRKSDNQLMLIPMVMSDYVADLQRQLEEAKSDRDTTPLCANHAQTWFTARNEVRSATGCWLCDAEAQLVAMREALQGMLELDKHHVTRHTVNAEWASGIVADAKAALAYSSTEAAQWQRERDAKVLRKMGAFFEERAKNLTTQQPDYALKFANMHYAASMCNEQADALAAGRQSE